MDRSRPIEPVSFPMHPIGPTTEIRFPREEDSAERHLVRAERARRARSLARLSDLVPGVDWDGLANATDGVSMMLGAVPPPKLELLVDLGSLQESPGALDGGPLAVEHLRNDLVTTFAATAEIAVRSEALSSPDAPTWSDHDTFLLVTLGSFDTQVHEPTSLSALRPFSPSRLGELAWAGPLPKGSFAFIPRGWGYRSVGTHPQSSMIQISLRRQSVREIFAYLHERSGSWPILRADVPYDIESTPSSYAGSVFDDRNALRAHMNPLVGDIIEHAVARWRALAPIPHRPRQARPDRTDTSAWRNATVEVPTPNGIMIARGAHDGQLLLAVGGAVTEIPRGLTALVAAMSGGPVAADDLADHAPYLDEPTFHEVLSGLHDCGLMIVG